MVLFENFKKFLSPEDAQRKSSTALKARAHDGSAWDVSRVLQLTFKAAHECILNRIEATFPDISYEEAQKNIVWQVTVPNLWDEYAKVRPVEPMREKWRSLKDIDSSQSAMRQAAVDAGLIDSVRSDKLVFCLEPEAAVVRHLVNERNRGQLVIDQGVLVADNGGGTVDITSHVVISVDPLQFRSIEVPSGGMWGSKAVDDNFVALAQQLFRLLSGSDEAFIEFQVS